MGIERTELVRSYTPLEAGNVIDKMLRQRSVTGNPLGRTAIAALTRGSMIAAGFGVSGERESDIEKAELISQAATARRTQGIIDDPRLPFRVRTDVINPASLEDGRSRAQELSQSGSRTRVPTEPELLRSFDVIREDMRSGRETELTRLGKKIEYLYIATETPHEDYPGYYVFRCLGDGVRGVHLPGSRYYDRAALLVEDRS